MVNRWQKVNEGLYGSSVTALLRTDKGTLVAGMATEGIYTSSDDANTWTWQGNGLRNIGTSTAPAYPQVRTLVQMGSRILAGTSQGLYASSNGGQSWSILSADLAQMQVYSILASPSDPTLLLAGTNDGVFRSLNGGSAWGAVNANMRDVTVRSLVLDRWKPSQIYAATSSGLFKSFDSGMTWRLVSSQLSGSTLTCVVQYPVASRPDTLYAGTTTGVFRSFDGGSTWSVLGAAGSAQGGVLALWIDEFDPMLVTVLDRQGVDVSKDGGETWAQKFAVGSDESLAAGLMLSGPSAARFILGGRGGVSLWDGTRLSSANTGLGFINVKAVAFDPKYQVQYAVRGVSLFTRTGASDWQVLNGDLGNAEVLGIAIDRTQPRVLYAATGYGLLRSVDGGHGWARIAVTPSDVRGRILSVVVDPADPAFLYAGNAYGLYRDSNGLEAAWEKVGTSEMAPVIGIAVAPGDPNTLYALTPTSVWKTADHCATWTKLSGALGALAPTSIAITAGADRAIYLGTGKGVLRSQDDGLTWTAAGIGLEGETINSVCLLDDAGSRLLAGSVTGAWVSSAFEDNTPPVLSVSSPATGTTVSAAEITIVGAVRDGESAVASLTINGAAVQFDGTTGAFSVVQTLVPGSNSIVIAATDIANNRVERAISVLYKRPSTVLVLHVGSQTMTVDGRATIVLDAAPVIMRSRTFLPIRAVAEALGGTVGWDVQTRTATVTLGIHRVSLQIGSSVAILDGVRRPIDSADALVVPVIASGRTLLPVRFVAESLGCQVDWDSETKQITITYEGT
jgi:photosystem II stability/assembly factor-like uncharacterized protein